jgi:hypothetical protein
MPDDVSDEEHQAAFVTYCEQRSKEYRRIFGTEKPKGQIILPPTDLSLFAWPGGGVYQFPPRKTKKLKHWHYVTEALSQPDNPAEAIKNGYPYYAFELVMSTTEECIWASNVLINLARYYLGPKGRPFYHWQCIPCNGPLVIGWETQLTYMISVAAQEYEPIVHLPGGDCALVHMVGVSEAEVKPCFEIEQPTQGIQALYRVLCKHGIGSCSIPERPSLTDDPTFLDEWRVELELVQAEK